MTSLHSLTPRFVSSFYVTLFGPEIRPNSTHLNPCIDQPMSIRSSYVRRIRWYWMWYSHELVGFSLFQTAMYPTILRRFRRSLKFKTCWRPWGRSFLNLLLCNRPSYFIYCPYPYGASWLIKIVVDDIT